ncbi:hypothetical protein D3C86_1914730 [compost metagenome]
MLLNHSIHLSSDSGVLVRLRQAQNSFLRQVETVHLIQNAHIEWSRDIAVLTVAVYMQIMVVAIEEQVFNKPFIAVECEDHRFVFCEKLIKLFVG